MTAVTVEVDTIKITLDGMDKVWALKGGIEIPLAQVRSVQIAPANLRPKGFRAPGTFLPGRVCAGTWRGRGTKEFWNVRRKGKTLVLELEGGEYTRVAIDVDDPAALAVEIEQARTSLARTAR